MVPIPFLQTPELPLKKERGDLDSVDAQSIRGLGDGSFAGCRAAFPKLSNALVTGFVVASWGLHQRWRRAAQHFDAAAWLGAPFDLKPYSYVELIDLSKVWPGCRLTLDQPSWLFRDGLLALSLWVGLDRVFTLSFLFGFERGRFVAFVGGLQGRGDEAALDLYRAMTKAAHGIRPRDFLIELFRLICAEIGVSDIYGVSNSTQYHNTLYYRFIKRAKPLGLNFDNVWVERGGVILPNRLFKVSPGLHLRDLDQIPAKKRVMYRLRAALMLEIRSEISAALTQPERLITCHHSHHYISGGHGASKAQDIIP